MKYVPFLLLASVAYAVEPVPMRAFEVAVEASGKAAAPAPLVSPWEPKTIFVLRAVTKDAAALPAYHGTGAEIKWVWPLVYDGCRIYSGTAVDGVTSFGFPGREGYIDAVIYRSDNKESAWSMQLKQNGGFSINQLTSWDGSTVFCACGDNTLRQFDGTVVWRLPADVDDMVRAGNEIGLWNTHNVRGTTKLARFVPGAVSNAQASLVELSTEQSLDGTRQSTLTWLKVGASGVERSPFRRSSAYSLTELYRGKSGEFAAANINGCAGVIRYTDRNMIVIYSATSQGMVESSREFSKERVEAMRYLDGYLVSQIIPGSVPNAQVVGTAGNQFPFRMSAGDVTRINLIDGQGVYGKTWLLPGAWNASPVRMRGNYIMLCGENSESTSRRELNSTILFDPSTGAIAPAVYLSRTGPTDAIWEGDHVAFNDVGWSGDVDLVRAPARLPVIQPLSASAPPSTHVVDGQQVLQLRGEWRIAEGPGTGGQVVFAANGQWTSPWSDFGGTWTAQGTSITLTANRPVTATLLPDGKIRIVANVTLVLQKVK